MASTTSSSSPLPPPPGSPGKRERTTGAASDAKVAIVTGAAGVLGKAITKMLLLEGYSVACFDVRAAALEEMKAALVAEKESGAGSGEGEGWAARIHPFAVDIGAPEQVEHACKEVVGRLGVVTVLVNNAGLLSNHKCAETSLAEWHRVFRVNVDGALLLSQQVLPAMKSMRFGRIVNVTSMAAKTGGVTAGTAYAASKGAMSSLTFSLAREAAAAGVTVNGIAPAYIRTPMVMEQLTEAQRQAVLAAIPVGRFCEPDEVAHTVRFLISPLAGFVTGEIIDQNGGYHMD